ncbi:MAG: hypothetical protein E7044_02735 [Lentisphaerae bacterium]|nr:hypothetical protein [Lentisphaerota bacterium]
MPDNPINYAQIAIDYKHKTSFILTCKEQISSRISGRNIAVTRKIDGTMQIVFFHDGKVCMANTGGKVLENLPCLDDFAEQLKKAGIRSATVAAELYVPSAGVRPRCYDTLQALKDKTPDSAKKLCLAPFDLLELEGESFKNCHYEEKHAKLAELFDSDFVRPVEMQSVSSVSEVEQIFSEWVIEGGAEGLVVHSEMPFSWKVKPRHTIDAVVVGYTVNGNEIRNLLFAVCRGDGSFQVFGVASNGLTAGERISLPVELEKQVVPSEYIRTDSSGIAFRMVRPQRVYELSVGEFISENHLGKIRWNPLLELTSDGWKCKAQTPGVSAIAMSIVRFREDKVPEFSFIPVNQLSDLCPFAEKQQNLSGDPSTILARRVFKKVSGAKTMVQKFIIWKTNKEHTGNFPAYIFHHTDYSATRKEALKRDLRTSSSEEQIRRIMDDFIAGNIKKGWEEVL